MAESYGQSKVERINPKLTCMLTKGPSVDPAVFCLGGWHGVDQAPRVVLPSYALAESKETGAMPTGLFKTSDLSVQVDYDGVSIPIPS